MRKILFLLTMAACLLSACQNEEAQNPSNQGGEKITVNIAIDGDSENTAGTKSVITQAENGIADITLFFFLNGKLSESIYTVPESSGALTIESTKGYAEDAAVDVYGLVNMGDKRSLISEGKSISTLKNWKYSLTSVTEVNTSGFPMAGIETNAPVGKAFTLTVHRLFAKYGFRLNTSGLKYGTFTVTGLTLKNAAKNVTPFIEGSKAVSTTDVMDGDYATTENVTTLKNGGGVYFYTMENMQGTLLTGNTDPWKKIPSYIGTNADLSTYIQITGTYKDHSGGLTANHTYNMYLGQDNVTNFDVIRNTKYEYTLTLADDGFLKATWKAGREIVSDTRAISFGNTKYEIEYDEDCPVAMSFNPGHIDCIFTLSSNLVAAGVTFDPDYMVLRQTKELDEDVTGTLTATSWDKTHSATCTVVAKEYKPGDVIIIIKPSENTINMTEPDAQTAELSLALVNPDDHTEIYEKLDGTDWTVGSSNSTSFNAEFTVTKASASTVKLRGKNAGTGYITASCKYDGVTYNSINGADNKITVNEDRTITISGLPETIYKGKAYPCTVKTNYDGDVNISTSLTSLIFSESRDGSTPTKIPLEANTEKEMFVRYTGTTNTTVSLNAQTTNNAVKESKNVAVNSTEYGIMLSPTSRDIAVGKTANFVALYGIVIDGALSSSPQIVTSTTKWTSSDPSVVTIGDDGGITGISKGTAIITADYDGYIREATVRVFNSITNDIVLDPTTITIGTGKTKDITAIYNTYGDGEIIDSNDITSSATWSSDNSHASVTKGTVKGLSVGSSIITAKYSTSTATADVTVFQSYNATLLVIAQGNPTPALTNKLDVTVQDNTYGLIFGEPNNDILDPWIAGPSITESGVPEPGAFINTTTSWAYKDLSVFDNLNQFTINISGLDVYSYADTPGGSKTLNVTPTVETSSPTTLFITVNVNISTGKVELISATVTFR